MKSTAYAYLLLTIIPLGLAGPISPGLSPAKEPDIANKDATETYLAVISDLEKRSWDDVFADMGYDHDKLKRLPASAEFSAFGHYSRAFTLRMSEAEKRHIESFPHIAYVEKNHEYSPPAPVIHKDVPGSHLPYEPRFVKMGSTPDKELGKRKDCPQGNNGGNASPYASYGNTYKTTPDNNAAANNNYNPAAANNYNTGATDNNSNAVTTVDTNTTDNNNSVATAVDANTANNSTSQEPKDVKYSQQQQAPYPLERISNPQKINQNGRRVTDLSFTYTFDDNSGAGVDVYDLDSGININHVEFEGRAKHLFSVFGQDFEDRFGHGTHTAGTIGSRAYGVAKKVNIFNCRVLDAQNRGNAAWYSQGLEAALKNHEQRKNSPDFKGSVVNMSFGGDNSQYFFQLIQRALQSGMHISASAGNEGSDACSVYPAAWSLQTALISVGATDINDNRWESSNYGRCVTVHAPGHYIVSTYNQGPQSKTYMSGTSMSAPIVSGLIADLLPRFPEYKLNPMGMKQFLERNGVRDIIRGASAGNIMVSNMYGRKTLPE
ncbi:hypothetical protein H072_2669 [Dactylellina haptotyla CBS 200.50]|uniref:Peptidase S8/S53 domain-containing protein n=1 Tax=Dactylellina haptotyla (strain CBS 200.50) TaxID=1284197 RepID=S8AQM9_DACHA|nr:hypothetical protein H072_2669 [Dactylellina haptotyla CBS 200.50]